MAEYSAPLKDMRFVLDNIADLAALSKLEGYEHAESDVVDAVLEEAGKFASNVLSPINKSGDLQGSHVKDGVVTTPDGWKEAYAGFVEGGWNGISAPEQYDGGGLPSAVSLATVEMWNAANLGFALCPLLTQGAIESIIAHGTKEQQDKYLKKLVSGEWAATMNLTESQAGSDVGALRSKAEPAEDGSWRISGQKIFITYGDHEMSENIIHLVLARTPGAPAGTRGISLFIVPKYLVNEDGSLGERNDLKCVSLEEKIGIHASPTAVMSYGDNGNCVGYLLGAENKGMACMFTMMNSARLGVGVQGLAIAERAYQQAVEYARDRKQDAVQNAARLCEALGHQVVEDVPAVDGGQLAPLFGTLWAAFGAWTLRDWEARTGRTATPEQFEKHTWIMSETDKHLRASDLAMAMQNLQRFARKVAGFHETYDVWLTPTMNTPPPPLGFFEHDKKDRARARVRMEAAAYYTSLCNVTGQPAISLPLHQTADGLPVGVQLIGRYGDEATLFRLSAQLEAAQPWAGRWPGVS